MKILFVAYGGGHIASLLPVIRAASSAGHEVLTIGLTSARKTVRDAGFDCMGFADLLEYASPHAYKYGEQLLSTIEAPSIGKDESRAYLGVGFAGLVEEFGEPQAHELYEEHGRTRFLPVKFFRRVLRSLLPDVVVATSAPRSERAAILAAGQLRIPSVCIVDLFAMAEIEWVGQSGFADKVCVLGDAVKRRLVQAGRDPADVVVTGNPAFDNLASSEFVGKGRSVRDGLGWSESFVVGWASQREPSVHPFSGRIGNPELPAILEQELVDWATANEGSALLVRHHPNERRDYPSETARVKISQSSQPVEVMLHAVDVVVTIASTVGLQAALLGKPVVSYDSSVLSEGAPLSSMGFARGISKPGQLSSVLMQLSEHASVPEGSLPSLGRSADRVLALVEELSDG